MNNQGPNPAFTGPQEKSRTGQSVPPPYYPNAEYQIPRVNPNPSGYHNQPYGAPGGPQAPYAQQSYPGMSAYPQVAYVGQTAVTIQSTVSVAPIAMAAPDYLGYSIFTLLCCCFPLGIAAVIYSCFVSIHSSRTFSASCISHSNNLINHPSRHQTSM